MNPQTHTDTNMSTWLDIVCYRHDVMAAETQLVYNPLTTGFEVVVFLVGLGEKTMHYIIQMFVLGHPLMNICEYVIFLHGSCNFSTEED